MVDPVTVNRSLAQPTRGSDVGTWDVPVNGNFGLLDTITGGITSIATTGGNTNLNAAQLACGSINVSGALVAQAGIIFPAIQGWWSIQNLCTGNFPLVIFSGTATDYISMPPGQITDIQINGNSVRYRSLPPIGTYLDYAGSAVPVWMSTALVRPYLYCDGSAFSGATYPYLSSILGGTTLPDLRGRARFAFNDGTARITTAVSGINGDVVLSAGGDQILQTHTHVASTGNDNPDHTHPFTQFGTTPGNTGGGAFSFTGILGSVVTNTAGASVRHTHPVTVNNAGTGASQNMPPATISGITLIRSG